MYTILYIQEGIFIPTKPITSKKAGEDLIKKIVNGLNLENIDEAKGATISSFLWSSLGLNTKNEWENRKLPYYETEFEVVEIPHKR